MKQRIPKIIHYCWFGNNKLSDQEKKCIRTWKKILPDYEFKFWNEDTFNVNDTEWTRTAYELKKYAFVSDYVRLWALRKYGGIYIDTDVKMLQSFTPLLNQEMILCFEDVPGQVVATCVIGAVKNHEVINEMLKYYNRPFNMSIISKNEANVVIMTKILVKHGLKLNGQEQILKGIHVYPRTYFCPMDFWGNWDKTVNTFCIHLFSGSWLADEEKKRHNYRNKLIFKIGKKMYGYFNRIPAIKSIRSKIKI